MDSMCTNGHVQLHGAPCSCGAPKAVRDPWVQTLGVGASIHGLIESERVVQVRGMNLRPCEWVTFSDKVGMVICDVVRRQSDLDAEMWAEVTSSCNAIAADLRAKNPCPECGPLLESWVDCTMCRPTTAAPSRDSDDLTHLAFDHTGIAASADQVDYLLVRTPHGYRMASAAERAKHFRGPT